MYVPNYRFLVHVHEDCGRGMYQILFFCTPSRRVARGRGRRVDRPPPLLSISALLWCLRNAEIKNFRGLRTSTPQVGGLQRPRPPSWIGSTAKRPRTRHFVACGVIDRPLTRSCLFIQNSTPPLKILTTRLISNTLLISFVLFPPIS